MEGGGREEGGEGEGILGDPASNWGVLNPSNCILTSSHPLPHSHECAKAHAHTDLKGTEVVTACNFFRIPFLYIIFFKINLQHRYFPAKVHTSFSALLTARF